jgi:adenosylmethionine-8-amino-7-oxononanoate aminotransferase
MGNPLACAVASASIELLLSSDWRANVERIEAGLRAGLAAAAGHPAVRDVRVRGAIGVIQLRSEVDVPAVTASAVALGVWLRPFRDLIYAMPPYICSDDEISMITKAMVGSL